MLAAAGVHARLVHRYGDTEILSTLRQARHFLSYWANSEQSATNPFEQTSLATNIAVYPDLIAIGATLATHRQQVEQQQTSGHRTAWPLALIEQINERTGQAHTDITPIEQWVHNQRFIAARRSPSAGEVQDGARARESFKYRTMKDIRPTQQARLLSQA
ncbi:Uncharacterised protein [Mycobacteroides abscessus subsp. abscessus]|nr:Uncharacterised protein [Mycobacteroides abscessus subsp. abscessus]